VFTPVHIGSVVLLSASLGAASLSAASLQLTPREIDDAIRGGRQSLIQSEFSREWQVSNPAGEEVTVQTPFYRLALLARNSAFKGEELQAADIDKLVKASQGRLNFWVVLRGATLNFAKTYQPALLVEGREVKAVFVQNEYTALPTDDGRYLARCVYSFPTEGLNPRASLSLVVRTFEGQEVSRFAFDLSAMR